MRSNWRKQMMISALALTLSATNVAPVFASAAPDGKTNAADIAQTMGTTAQWNRWEKEWETLKNDWTQISLSPGSNATELNFAWYTPKQTNDDHSNANVPKLIIGEGRNMKNAKVYEAEQTAVKDEQDNNGETYNSNKVTATGLKENKTYYYSYDNGNGYTKPAKYTTKSTNNFSFAFVGDPQIGSSNELKGKDTKEFYDAQSNAVKSDAFNWSSTLNAALEKTDNKLSFVVSAGDQIQTTKKKSPNKDASKSEIEYTGYLSPEALKSLPVATTVGNHDADNANYTYHFNRTNASELGSNKVVGGDYYFTYGNTLFMKLNTQDTNAAEHKQFMEQAIAANPNCTWRVVTLHQDIYGSAEHSNEPEITNLRYTLVPYFEANDVDVVLTGHDHAYSRTHILEGGHKTVEYTDDEFDAKLDKDMDAGENPATRYEAPANISADSKEPADVAYLNYLNAVMDKDAIEDTEKGETVVNPDGILYMTANSSSGSKYYDLVPRMQSYIANRWQEDVPTYSVIDVTDNTFTINTYRTDNDQKIDETFTIKKGVTEDIKSASVGKVKNQIYTGKQIQPALKVTLNGKTLKAGKDYTVTYTDNKNTGLAKATINGIGKYTGTQTVTFKIVPKKAVLKTVKAGKSGTATVTIGKAGGKVSGYAIQVSTDSSFKKVTTYRTAKTTYTLKNLSKGKTYYVRVKAFTKVSDKNVYGAASKTIKVKAK